ncbi:MAG: hypothetical protein JXM69_18380 [Anaerolineae bacterium]|nr:hypothetical protein [Anaerolineae bacterium]
MPTVNNVFFTGGLYEAKVFGYGHGLSLFRYFVSYIGDKVGFQGREE